MTSESNRRRARPAVDRFWPKVRRGAGCWEWQGYRNPRGYGMFNVDNTVPQLAHRFAWELHNGPIPAGFMVCHTCDNPPCVRPGHLFLGTDADNMRDMSQKGRHVGTRRLTPDQVLAIRDLYASGEVQSVIAAAYRISQSAVSVIVTGKRWPHLGGAG